MLRFDTCLADRTLEESLRCSGVASLAEVGVHNLPILVDCPIAVGPSAVEAAIRFFNPPLPTYLYSVSVGSLRKQRQELLFAVGVREVMRTGRGAVWGPRLLGLFGVAYIIGGLLTADPVAGFPPGTTPEMVYTTWHGAVQNASRGASTILLISASLVIATWLAAEEHRGWAWFYGTAFPVVLTALTAVGFVAIGHYYSAFALAILATPWILVTAIAIHLYRREANRRTFGEGQRTRNRLIAG